MWLHWWDTGTFGKMLDCSCGEQSNHHWGWWWGGLINQCLMRRRPLVVLVHPVCPWITSDELQQVHVSSLPQKMLCVKSRCYVLLLFTVASRLQTRWLSWSPMRTRPSTSGCSSTVSCWTGCPWTPTRMAASSTQSSPPTPWSQSTPRQKYVVSDATSTFTVKAPVD